MISELIINAFLVTIMLAIGIALLKTRTVIFTVVLTSAYSLIAALMFITLDAVDVAFTEASVGAGISTILFFLHSIIILGICFLIIFSAASTI